MRSLSISNSEIALLSHIQCLQVHAAAQSVQGELHLAAWSMLLGPDTATLLPEKVVPDRLDSACSPARDSSKLHISIVGPQTSSTSWQVQQDKQINNQSVMRQNALETSK